MIFYIYERQTSYSEGRQTFWSVITSLIYFSSHRVQRERTVFVYVLYLIDPSFRTLNSKSDRSKPRRQPFQLTYEGGVDFESKFKASKATSLTKATLQKYCQNKTTLPEDLHFPADKLFRLFHRQKIMVWQTLCISKILKTDACYYKKWLCTVCTNLLTQV